MDLLQLPADFEKRLPDILSQQPLGMFEPRTVQSFRINTLKVTVEEIHALLKNRGIDFQMVGWCPYAIVVTKEIAQEILRSELIEKGLLYSQGLESMLPVLVLDIKPGQRVLDLCAAPGSKTSQIAMHMQNQGTLKANEPVRQRLYKLKSVLTLTGAQAQLSSVDGRRLQEHNTLFDRILVDAPCSCEGRFLKNDPKSFGFWSLRKIKEMSHKQKGILLNASRLLAPGGIMVYATCTFAPEENEEVVDWFLRKADGQINISPISLGSVNTAPCLVKWQNRDFDSRVSSAVRILPDVRMEGFFIAKFTKSHYK